MPPPTAATEATRLDDTVVGTTPDQGQTISDAMTALGNEATTPRPRRGAASLEVGQDFGARYHIIRVLGAGGMGAVYQAWDKVLEVAVAVKVIRPDATLDPEAARALEKRFKRELLLARQVTHRHVVRIHDLGEVDGILYITMPYVQGADLNTVLKREGPLAVDRAVSIARQVASGLVAAHEAGVVHRDLKPANIMVDADDSALIMDFGIARSTSGGTALGMTVAGGVVGTVEFMAPEQARGDAIDHRADLYSFGLILSDMLLGRRRVGGSTAIAELLDRMQHAPRSVREVDPVIPAWVDALITRCLQPNPALRYQTMSEVVAEIDAHVSNATTSASMAAAIPQLPPVVTMPAPRPLVTRPLVVGAALLLVLSLGWAGWTFRDRFASDTAPPVTQPVVTGPAISLAILPFRNASGDPALDALGSSVSQVLGTMLGQSSRVRTVPSDRVFQVLQDLRIPSNQALAPAQLASVADLTAARRVLWGQYSRFGDAIRIDATLQDLDRQESRALNAMAANEASLLSAITELGEAVSVDLARGSSDILSDLKSTSWRPSTSSFEALSLYNEGTRFTRQGRHQEALKRFEAATKADGNFALAHSGLAQAYSALGYDDQASQSSRRAMSLAGALPPQEKYLVSANHYRIGKETANATEAYENLAKASPNDASVLFDLARLYEQSGQFEQARQHLAKVVELDPHFVEGLLALGRVEIRRGNPQESLGHLNAALTLAIRLDNDEGRGNILQAIGIAYKLLGRPDEALRHYEQSLDIKRRLGNKGGMAGSLGEIAQIQALVGNAKEAEVSYNAALKLQREIGDRSGMSISLVNLASLLNENLGRPDAALPLLREALQIRREAGNPNGEAIVLNNIGSVYLAKGEFSEAQTYFERTLEIREKTNVPSELANTLHNLGETLARMGRYDQSLARYHRALELRRGAGDRRGAAIESYSIGTIFEYIGRYGAAVKSKDEALKAFRELNQRDMWLGEILSGYGNSLSLIGRLDEAGTFLDEAMTVAGSLQNPNLIAQTLRFQADRLTYSGDVGGAASLSARALEAAKGTSDRSLSLLARAKVAEIAAQRPTKAVATQLATLSQEADTLGLKSLAVESALHRIAVLVATNDRATARQEVERTLAKAEALGFRLLVAKAHYLRGEVLRGSGEPDAHRAYASALRLLGEITTEEGSRTLLERADLRRMHAECERWSKTP